MADVLAKARLDLAIANRIVSHEGIIDAFGHVSMRHPTRPDRYLLARSRSPELVEPGDIYEYTLDSEPVKPLPNGLRGYGERVIHGEIYKARPDVNAVAHHHGMAMLPFCNSGMPLQPVYHMGALLGEATPFWDSRDEFGDTHLLVVKPEEGASLARALGPHWLVVMRRHGATVVGTNLIELVFRTIYTYRNAELQLMIGAQGMTPSPLTPKERELAGARNLEPRPQGRAWEYWCTRLKKAGEYPTDNRPAARSSASIASRPQKANARTSPKTAAKKTTAKAARPIKKKSAAAKRRR